MNDYERPDAGALYAPGANCHLCGTPFMFPAKWPEYPYPGPPTYGMTCQTCGRLFKVVVYEGSGLLVEDTGFHRDEVPS